MGAVAVVRQAPPFACPALRSLAAAAEVAGLAAGPRVAAGHRHSSSPRVAAAAAAEAASMPAQHSGRQF